MGMAEIIESKGQDVQVQRMTGTAGTTPEGTTPTAPAFDFDARAYIVQLDGQQRQTLTRGKVTVQTTHRAYLVDERAAILCGQAQPLRRIVDAYGYALDVASARPVLRSLTDGAVDHYIAELVDTGKTAGKLAAP